MKIDIKNLLSTLAGLAEVGNIFLPTVPPASCAAVGLILRSLQGLFFPEKK